MVNTLKLRARIVEAGFSQKKLARAVGMSENTLSAKLNGKKSFNCDEAELICNILAISDPADKAQIFLPQASQ